ncbi:MAG: thiol:disulfide interchange protein DsbA/DsbL [Candidatus Endonucleobacter sp. (ex Gigantidas childressi)]|nr:thiol:disulfide interchange protein DsbA/DsbL [Candidatus Endonucleobacter sp. (ex Gigantidas childressi)]
MPIITKLLWLLLFYPLIVSAYEKEKVTEEINAEVQQLSPKYTADKDYRVLENPEEDDATASQIVVAEVFWYGCPHCYTLEAIVSLWKTTLPKTVKFIRVPAFFGSGSPAWKIHAQLYYTLQSMGLIDKVHYGVFEEIQNQRRNLDNTSEMAAFLKKRFKVDKGKFLKNYKSLTVSHQLLKAFKRTRKYGITGVPALVIGGRYIVEPSLAGSLDNMTEIADYLVAKIQSERDKKSMLRDRAVDK